MGMTKNTLHYIEYISMKVEWTRSENLTYIHTSSRPHCHAIHKFVHTNSKRVLYLLKVGTYCRFLKLKRKGKRA